MSSVKSWQQQWRASREPKVPVFHRCKNHPYTSIDCYLVSFYPLLSVFSKDGRHEFLYSPKCGCPWFAADFKTRILTLFGGPSVN